MAAMSTALTVFTDNGNYRTYTYTGHTVSDVRLVIQGRKVPATATAIQEDTIKVVSSTQDSVSGETLDGKISFEAKFRAPANRVVADATAALAVYRDIVASDEFAAMVTGQTFVKS